MKNNKFKVNFREKLAKIKNEYQKFTFQYFYNNS